MSQICDWIGVGRAVPAMGQPCPLPKRYNRKEGPFFDMPLKENIALLLVQTFCQI